MLPARLLNKQATVLRFAETGTDRRNHKTGAYLVHGTVLCSLQTLSGDERYSIGLSSDDGLNAETVVIVQHRAFMQPNADVNESDRLLIDGQTYHIAHVADPTGHAHHLEVDLYRVKGNTRI